MSTFKCKQCESEFTPLNPRQKVFCSSECRIEYGNAKLMAKNKIKSEENRKMVSYCKQCGKEIVGNRKFCSKSCTSIWHYHDTKALSNKQLQVKKAPIQIKPKQVILEEVENFKEYSHNFKPEPVIEEPLSFDYVCHYFVGNFDFVKNGKLVTFRQFKEERS